MSCCCTCPIRTSAPSSPLVDARRWPRWCGPSGRLRSCSPATSRSERRARSSRGARAFVDRPGAFQRLLAIPGNHDIPLFDAVHPPASRRMRDTARPSATISSRSWMCRTCSSSASTRRAGTGTRTARSRRSRLNVRRAALAQGSARQLRVVVVHQPVAVTREEDAQEPAHRPRGGRAALGRGRAPTWSSAGTSTCPSCCRCTKAPARRRAGCGACRRAPPCRPGVRAGAPNSVNLIRFEGGDGERRCTVEQWDCDVGVAQFRRARVHSLALGTGHPGTLVGRRAASSAISP